MLAHWFSLWRCSNVLLAAHQTTQGATTSTRLGAVRSYAIESRAAGAAFCFEICPKPQWNPLGNPARRLRGSGVLRRRSLPQLIFAISAGRD